MEAAGIPYNDFSLDNLRYELDSSMAITTHAQVFDNSDCCLRWRADYPKCKSKLLTVVAKHVFLLFLLQQLCLQQFQMRIYEEAKMPIR